MRKDFYHRKILLFLNFPYIKKVLKLYVKMKLIKYPCLYKSVSLKNT